MSHRDVIGMSLPVSDDDDIDDDDNLPAKKLNKILLPAIDDNQ